MDVLILDDAILPHESDGADHAVLDGLPVVDDDLAGLLDAVIGDLEVGHVHDESALLQPVGLNERLVRQRDADDDITLADGLLRGRGGDELDVGILGFGLLDKASGALRADIVDINLLDAGTDHHRGFELRAALSACTADRQNRGALLGQKLHGDTAGSAGALGADFSTVGHADGQLGVGVVQNDGNAGAGQAFLVVHRAAADPLDTGHVVLAADVAGHGVDTAVDVFVLSGLAPAHGELARGDDVALLDEGVGALHIVHDGGHVAAAELFHGLIVQKQNIDLAHNNCFLSFVIQNMLNFRGDCFV